MDGTFHIMEWTQRQKNQQKDTNDEECTWMEHFILCGMYMDGTGKLMCNVHRQTFHIVRNVHGWNILFNLDNGWGQTV